MLMRTARLSRREGPRPALGRIVCVESGSLTDSVSGGTGSGWDARKKARSQKSEFLQRASITIAKVNSRVLDSTRHDRQSATAPDLVGH